MEKELTYSSKEKKSTKMTFQLLTSMSPNSREPTFVKKNIKVVRYHKMCGAEIIDENDSDYIFKSTRVKYLERKKSLFNILEDKNMLDLNLGMWSFIVSVIKQYFIFKK